MEELKTNELTIFNVKNIKLETNKKEFTKILLNGHDIIIQVSENTVVSNHLDLAHNVEAHEHQGIKL